MEKWTEQSFFKRRSPNSQKYIKKLNILDIKEMQIKATLRFHLSPVRMTIIKNTNNNKCW
jgi:hypothetical protein